MAIIGNDCTVLDAIDSGDFGKQSKTPIACKVKNSICDLSSKVEKGIDVELIYEDEPLALEILRHSVSHVMADAVKKLFPDAKLAIGPSIENGFYYDFDVSKPFVPEDLTRIESKMNEIINADLPFIREDISKDQAIGYFNGKGEKYKVSLLEDLDSDTVSLYKHGDFVDLCRGPHIPSTKYIKHFKLLTIAGAYWRGDERNPMLQRIYGSAFFSADELLNYFRLLELAKERDHRKLGTELDLFSMHEEAGPGLVYWHPKGAAIRTVVEDFWRDVHKKKGYKLIYIPHIAKANLWEISGHLECYNDNMYSPIDVDGQKYFVKPMNCPGHILIYKSKIRSYRELPIKYAELGSVYRYERSGVLHGLLRVRGFTQDDAHIFCRPDQLLEEIIGVINLMDFMMKSFGLEYRVYLATKPDKHIGSDDVWEQAENALRGALEHVKIGYKLDEGGGAFYGPKIDVKLVDALGRDWQGPTIQVDFNLPDRFDVNFIDNDSKQKRVVMIHRTVLGSMERFLGTLIEHYGGCFPVWLSPEQVRVLPISDKQLDFAREISDKFTKMGVRSEVDFRDEKIGHKIREAEISKVPYMFIIGRREVEQNVVSVRKHGEGDLGVSPVEKAIETVKSEAFAPTI